MYLLCAAATVTNGQQANPLILTCSRCVPNECRRCCSTIQLILQCDCCSLWHCACSGSVLPSTTILFARIFSREILSLMSAVVTELRLSV
jgi:hypothetical protein